MSPSKKISVVMVDGRFRESYHIFDTLLDQDFPADDTEIFWVDFYQDLAAEFPRDARIRTLCLGNPPDALYHPSRCFNAGIREASGEVIVIPDADVAFERSFLQSVWAAHSEYERLAVYFQRWDQPKDRYNGDTSLDYLKATCRLANPANFGGCISLRKKWLEAVNGYEEHRAFAGNYSATGYDLNTRLRNLGLAVMWHPSERIYHPWHAGSASVDDELRHRWMIATADARALARTVTACQGLDGSYCAESEPPPPKIDPDGRRPAAARRGGPAFVRKVVKKALRSIDKRI